MKDAPANPAATAFVQRRRRRLMTIWLIIGLVAVLAVLDHLGCFGYRGDDWARFDRQTFDHPAVVSPAELTVEGTVVRLIGVDPPPDPIHAAEAMAYLRSQVEGRAVTLRLEPTQTRDSADRLLAYVYPSDTDCLNLAMVREGQAYADRRAGHTFAGQMEQLENEARNPKRPRGLWVDVTFDQMPQWRQQWLRERLSATSPTTRRSD